MKPWKFIPYQVTQSCPCNLSHFPKWHYEVLLITKHHNVDLGLFQNESNRFRNEYPVEIVRVKQLRGDIMVLSDYMVSVLIDDLVMSLGGSENTSGICEWDLTYGNLSLCSFEVFIKTEKC